MELWRVEMEDTVQERMNRETQAPKEKGDKANPFVSSWAGESLGDKLSIPRLCHWRTDGHCTPH